MEIQERTRMPVSYELLKEREGFAQKVYHAGTRNEYFSAFCPFHDDVNVPSLMIYPIDITRHSATHDGYWRCLAGCGMGGLDALNRKIRGWERPDPAHRKKATGGVAWYPPMLPTDAHGLATKADTASEILKRYPELGWYLTQRGLHDRIEPRNLGYYDGWMSIPVYNSQGEIETLVLRSTPAIQEATGQRFHSPAIPPKLYVPNWASIGRRSYVYIVFGMFDALSLDEIGEPVCCATHGNQSLNPTWFLGTLWRDKQLLLVSDDPKHERDEVAERCLMLQNLGLSARMENIRYPEGCKDPNDILKAHGPEGLRKHLIGVL